MVFFGLPSLPSSHVDPLICTSHSVFGRKSCKHVMCQVVYLQKTREPVTQRFHKKVSSARHVEAHACLRKWCKVRTGETLVRKAVRKVPAGSVIKEAENPGSGLMPEALRHNACITIRASVPRRTDSLLWTACGAQNKASKITGSLGMKFILFS